MQEVEAMLQSLERAAGAAMAMSEPVTPLVQAISAEGGSALLVGGSVRDILLGRPAKDLDLEVFGIDAESLKAILGRYGTVNLVGQSFAVFKFRPATTTELEVDVSLPRHDLKTGTGHRGFTVSYDPTLSPLEASRRRDLTINSISFDPLSGQFIDPQRGIDDLRARRIRAVDATTFVEDSLRVLRVAQLAARLEFEVDSSTLELCRTIDLHDLPAERIREELFKLLLKARQPSTGFYLMNEMGAIDQLFPEIAALRACEQDPEYHPEGNVFVHTMLAIDEAAGLTTGLPTNKKLTVMLSVLAHDLGKPPTTTRVENGEGRIRIRSINHENVGAELARGLLDKLSVFTIDGYPVRDQIIGLIEEHLAPPQFHRSHLKGHEPGRRAFAKVVAKCDPELLALVSMADIFARPPLPKDPAPIDYFTQRIREFGFDAGLPQPLLMGRHILDAGIAEPGIAMGRILKTVYDKQLAGEITSVEQALELAAEIARDLDA
ncbi:MAG TPA: HD domain-containing protein [Blastocatellia bacterium]|nr:HD domain-containing protein [Blastocatellia bacterium]